MLTEKNGKNSNIGCFSFFTDLSSSLLFVLPFSTSKIMSWLSNYLSLSHDSQWILGWFYANKRGAGRIKSLCVWENPPHTLLEVFQSKRRKGESKRKCHHLLQPFKLVKMATEGIVQTLLFTLHMALHLIILLKALAHC